MWLMDRYWVLRNLALRLVPRGGYLAGAALGICTEIEARLISDLWPFIDRALTESCAPCKLPAMGKKKRN